MKNRQGLTIAALIIAIVGLSIGFAAFSNTLTISSSASVNPDPTSMNVVFSSSSSSAETALIQPTKNINDVTNFTATNATITGADYRTLNNVSAAFTEPGQSVTYNLYVYNAGSYKAYLNELNMGEKVCSIVENQEHPEQEATESLKNAACEGISISVSIDNVTLTSSGSLNNMELNVDSSKPVQIVISYASGSAYVDGPISVSFGNITFNASTVQAQSQGGNEQQGGQEEPSQVADTLTLTAEQLSNSYAQDISQDDVNMYLIEIDESNMLIYNDTYKYIQLAFNDQVYIWACDSNSVSNVASMFELDDMQANKWYFGTEGLQLYSGSSPISANSFGNTPNNPNFLTRVINSFNN